MRQKRAQVTLGNTSWDGYGATAAQASKDAEAKRDADLERLIKQSFSPRVFETPDGRIAVTHVLADGSWGYSFYDRLLGDKRFRQGGSATGGWTEREAERALRRNLAQQAIKLHPETGKCDSGEHYLEEDDIEGLKEHLAYCQWQIRYAVAKRMGKDDAACREYANG